MPIRSVVAPPTPFLSNAVKDGPGRGWGTITQGNRTVTHCRVFVAVFPLLEGGNAVRFFIFCFFSVWFSVSCRFFAVLLFLGSLFGKFFGSELLFLVVGVGRVFLGGVLLRFLIYVLAVRSRKRLEKFS